jgi:hypothetical protein
VGSLIACDALTALATSGIQELDSTLEVSAGEVVRWYLEAQNRLTDEASNLGVAPRELACTLLLSLVGPESAVIAQVGDGATVVKTQSGYSPAIWPQKGEYANTTNFLTSDRLSEVLEIRHIEDVVTDIAMFSDGLEGLVLKLSEREVHRPFLETLFTQLRNTKDVETLFGPLRDFLDSKSVNERTDDDKTLILASRIQ